MDDAGRDWLRAAMQQLHRNARTCHCILKLAQLIADLVASDALETASLAEVIQYRPRRQASRA